MSTTAYLILENIFHIFWFRINPAEMSRSKREVLKFHEDLSQNIQLLLKVSTPLHDEPLDFMPRFFKVFATGLADLNQPDLNH